MLTSTDQEMASAHSAVLQAPPPLIGLPPQPHISKSAISPSGALNPSPVAHPKPVELTYRGSTARSTPKESRKESIPRTLPHSPSPSLIPLLRTQSSCATLPPPMAADEYSTGGGGKLKLKGSKVRDGRVEKKKKKAGKKKEESGQGGTREEEREKERDGVREDTGAGAGAESGEKTPLNESGPDSGAGGAKTETEKRYEEVRRKRLHERLQREGVKSHKERVEELNTYLSRLSEHHDMYGVFLVVWTIALTDYRPKIGPG